MSPVASIDGAYDELWDGSLDELTRLLGSGRLGNYEAITVSSGRGLRMRVP